MEHSFNIIIAKKYGVVEAILINHLCFWIKKNMANNKNYFDGSYWTYNSMKALEEMYEYLSSRQIRYAMKKLIDNGIIKVGNYNDNPYDKTNWYAFTEYGISLLQSVSIDMTKLSNRSDKIVKPIPYIEHIKENNNDNKLSLLKEKRFIPPTLEEIINYCNERNNNVDAQTFYDYYQVNDWKDSQGKPIKNWKQKLITWEKKEPTPKPKNDTAPRAYIQKGNGFQLL